MVSIIVPVYNAENVLGYCLNSIISQTYVNLEVLVINDGSTDNSLEICENYAKIDSRIKVINVKNGGVSKARNIGIENATGDYIQFVDSDDVIAQDMTENLVKSLETYTADIVFCGMKVIETDEEYTYGKVIDVFSSEKMGSECVIVADNFFKEFPGILFDTVILEGPCNRLYVANIIKNNGIFFPEDVSLGEDFLFNLQYYSLCEQFVFLSQSYYFYMQKAGDSLTKRYRADLLENKLNLLKAYKSFMDQKKSWTENGKVQFANYCVGYFISALKNLFHEECNMKESEKKKQISSIINHSMFRENIQIAGWIAEEWRWLSGCVRFSDVGTVYNNCVSMFEKKVEYQEDLQLQIEEEQTENVVQQEIINERPIRKPWWLKQILINICDFILKIHYIKFIELIRNSLKIRSIKKTVVKCILKLLGKSQGYDDFETL